LANFLAHQDFIHEPNKTPVFYELDETLAKWKFFRVLSIWTGSTAKSMDGEQGHVYCNCSGECNSKQANAERQVYCVTAGVTPQIAIVSTSRNEECAILCLTCTKYRAGRVIAVPKSLIVSTDK
jgi:hypothetical protein